MNNLPLYVSLTFGATVIAVVWLFLRATHYSRTVLILISAWIIIQFLLSSTGFYRAEDSASARFPLLILPQLIFIIGLFLTKQGKLFIDKLDLGALTIFHVIRVPVELVLFWLVVHKLIPEAMSFEGRNFDIISGLSAPFVYYFGFVKKSLNKSILLGWNFLCLALLINVVSNALLSLPVRFQQFGFEQPNIGLGYFTFMLLPACLVPLALFSNVAAIRKLLSSKASTY